MVCTYDDEMKPVEYGSYNKWAEGRLQQEQNGFRRQHLYGDNI